MKLTLKKLKQAEEVELYLLVAPVSWLAVMTLVLIK